METCSRLNSPQLVVLTERLRSGAWKSISISIAHMSCGFGPSRTMVSSLRDPLCSASMAAAAVAMMPWAVDRSGVGVGDGVGVAVGAGVGDGVGVEVGGSVGLGVGLAVGVGVSAAVGVGAASSQATAATSNDNIITTAAVPTTICRPRPPVDVFPSTFTVLNRPL